MRNVLVGFTALVFVLGVATIVQATTLTFDDLPTPGISGSAVPTVYGGLNWSNFYYVDSANNSYNPSGYQAGMVSPRNVAFNAYANPAAASDGQFTLNSAYFTGAWNDGLNIHADGYLGGNIIDSADFLVNSTVPILHTFNWSGIDKVQFSSSGGVLHPGYSNGGKHFVIDDFSFTPAPEPSTLALLGVGTVGLLACVWRRRKRAQ
jgi:hypothetical protein